MAKEFTDQNFQQDVIDNPELSVVDFWAAWCGPCRAIAPTIEDLSKEYEGQVNIGKLDVDNNPETAVKYQITSIPAILFYKNGQVVDRLIGAQPKSVIQAKIEANK